MRRFIAGGAAVVVAAAVGLASCTSQHHDNASPADTVTDAPAPTTEAPPTTVYVPPSTTTTSTTEAPTTTTEAPTTTEAAPADTLPDYTYTEPTNPPCPSGMVVLKNEWWTPDGNGGGQAGGQVENDSDTAVLVNVGLNIWPTDPMYESEPLMAATWQADVPAHTTITLPTQSEPIAGVTSSHTSWTDGPQALWESAPGSPGGFYWCTSDGPQVVSQ